MARGDGYAVVGAGRWGSIVHAQLCRLGRCATQLAGIRLQSGESQPDYDNRISTALAGSGASVAWICVPPGPHVSALVRAALDQGMHVIVEKPWRADPQTSQALTHLAEAKKRTIAVHFQFCFIEELAAIRRDLGRGARLGFAGVFEISRANRLHIPASYNLGSHILAIRNLFFPEADVTEVRVGYEVADARFVALRKLRGGSDAELKVDFTQSEEPLIERFICAFERAVRLGRGFPLDLRFAEGVNRDILELELTGVLIDSTPTLSRF